MQEVDIFSLKEEQRLALKLFFFFSVHIMFSLYSGFAKHCRTLQLGRPGDVCLKSNLAIRASLAANVIGLL